MPDSAWSLSKVKHLYVFQVPVIRTTWGALQRGWMKNVEEKIRITTVEVQLTYNQSEVRQMLKCTEVGPYLSYNELANASYHAEE